MAKAENITDPLIEELVHRFYERVRADDLLGPIFAREIGDDWSAHLPKMVDFWSSVMLKTRRYSGRPVPAHFKIEGLEKAHFERWLTMFAQTADEIFVREKALEFVKRADQIAHSLKNAIDVQRGLLPGMDGALSG